MSAHLTFEAPAFRALSPAQQADVETLVKRDRRTIEAAIAIVTAPRVRIRAPNRAELEQLIAAARRAPPAQGS